MNAYINELKTYLIAHPPNYGYYDADSLLDMLYVCYTRYNPIDSATIRQDFSELERHLQHLTLTENDAISNFVCSLCTQHEHLAFIEGIHVGMRLFLELEQK